MSKIVMVIGITAAVLAIGTFVFMFTMNSHGPKFEEISSLLSPRIVEKPPAKMLIVEATGDPNTTVKPAFGLLFKTYFKIKDKQKGKMEAPRARWPKPFETPRDHWVGIYAIPVPAALTSLPLVASKDGLHAQLRDWQYGTVAEILHVGPYRSEDTSMAKLNRYVDERGYEQCGDHEEEYLKGPGFGYTNPEKYLTVLRFAVRRKL